MPNKYHEWWLIYLYNKLKEITNNAPTPITGQYINQVDEFLSYVENLIVHAPRLQRNSVYFQIALFSMKWAGFVGDIDLLVIYLDHVEELLMQFCDQYHQEQKFCAYFVMGQFHQFLNDDEKSEQCFSKAKIYQPLSPMQSPRKQGWCHGDDGWDDSIEMVTTQFRSI